MGGIVQIIFNSLNFPTNVPAHLRSFNNSRGPNRDPARVVLRRMCCLLFNLVCPLPSISLRSVPRMQGVPLIIRISELEFPRKVCQHQFQFCHHHPFGNTIPRSMFERPSCTLHRVEFMPRFNQPALGKKLVCSYPVFWGTLHSVVEYQHYRTICWAHISLIVSEVHVLSLTAGASWRE